MRTRDKRHEQSGAGAWEGGGADDPFVVWIILGCSKLVDKLGIYVRAYGSDEMRQCAAIGMREWVHLCMLT